MSQQTATTTLDLLLDKSLVAFFFAAFLLGAFLLARHLTSTVLKPLADGALGVVRDLDSSIKALNDTISTTTKEHDALMSDRSREHDKAAQQRHDALRAAIIDAHREVTAMLLDYMQRTNTSLSELRDALRDAFHGERFPSAVSGARDPSPTPSHKRVPAVDATIRSEKDRW